MAENSNTGTGRRQRGATEGLKVLLAMSVLAGVGGWAWLNQDMLLKALGMPAGQEQAMQAPATPVNYSQPLPAPTHVVARTLHQCVDSSNKILWSDQDCPPGTSAVALQPGSGTTYSSAEAMRPTRDMPPVYVPPPPSYAAGGPVVVGGGDDNSNNGSTPAGIYVRHGNYGDYERRRELIAEQSLWQNQSRAPTRVEPSHVSRPVSRGLQP